MRQGFSKLFRANAATSARTLIVGSATLGATYMMWDQTKVNFNLIKEKEELGNMFVTEQQRSWIEIQKIGQSKKLRMKIVVPSGLQGKFFQLVNHHIFEYTITFFIVFNTICMAL